MHDRLPLNLYLPECRQTVLEHIKKYKIQCLFIDNISSLYRTDLTNQMESWVIMQMFIIQLRKMGVALVLVAADAGTSSPGMGEDVYPLAYKYHSDFRRSILSKGKWNVGIRNDG